MKQKKPKSKLRKWLKKHPVIDFSVTFWAWAFFICSVLYVGYLLGILESSGQLYAIIDGAFASPEASITFANISQGVINNSDWTDCPNGSLFAMTSCLQDFVSANFFYNESKIGEPYKFERFYREGGVCTHFSQLYVDMAEYFGYKAEKKTIWMTSSSGHQFAIIYGVEGYCVADQKSVFCEGLA